MGQLLSRMRPHLALVSMLGLACTLPLGYFLAHRFGLIAPATLIGSDLFILLVSLHGALLIGMAGYFLRFLQPILTWQREHPGATLPERLSRHLAGFSNRYWSFYLFYALVFPSLQYGLGAEFLASTAALNLLDFSLLQLIVAIMAGMPGYLYSLSLLGRLNRVFGLQQIHVSMGTKVLLIGAYLPILSTALLLKYYGWRTGMMSAEIVSAWVLFSLFAFVLTALTVRHLNQSLQPVKHVIESSGASSNAALAKLLRPFSFDEIGYLVNMLGKLFSRLVEQESHVAAIVDNAAEGIIVLDQQMNIDTFNPAAERIFGYTGPEVRGKPLSWLIPQWDINAHFQPDQEVEVEALRKDRSTLSVAMRVSEMQQNSSTFYTCLVADISERKAAERALKQAEARYRNLVETAHDLVWSTDAEGRWTYLNNAVIRIYGYQPEDMLGRHYSQFQAPTSQEKDDLAFAQLLNGQELFQYETVHLDAKGNRRHISFNARPNFDEHHRVIGITGTARDITEQKHFERELTRQAQHDSLTGLYNRHYFQQELERVVSRVARSAGECALLYLDLDQFKYVNDTVGHAAGDRLLVECTDLLQNNIREGDLLARFGGDEFTALLYNIDPKDAARVAENLRDMFEHYRFVHAQRTFNVTCSVGLAIIDSSISSADEALSHADLACNISKGQGRNCVHIYNVEDNDKSVMAEDVGWVNRVREAVEEDRFELLFQPILDVNGASVQDYEVLLRLPTAEGQTIMPGGFLPAAERFGLVHSVDRWTITQAIRYLASLQEDALHATRFAINLSGRAFDDRDLHSVIDGLLRDTGLDPRRLTFEITESAAISNIQSARKFISRLKDLGCDTALDDFGSGFCSFTYLKHLPVDKLKIDGSFIQGLAHTEVDQAMVRSMNNIAHALGKKTVAEFVEDEATLELVREYGIDFAQGHYIGMPQADLLFTPSTGAKTPKASA